MKKIIVIGITIACFMQAFAQLRPNAYTTNGQDAADAYVKSIAGSTAGASAFTTRAQRHLWYSTNAIAALGQWPYLQDILIFNNHGTPTNHLSLFGNPWSVTNEVYAPSLGADGGGIYFGGTNAVTFNLPNALTNFSFFVFYRQDAVGLDLYDKTASSMQYLAGLRSTNDNSTLVATAYGNFRQNRVWEISGTNIWENDWQNSTNQYAPMKSGAFENNALMAPLLPTVLIVSGDTNGNIWVWHNGNPASFYYVYGNGTGTNKLVMNGLYSPVNQMLLGGNDPIWPRVGNGTSIIGTNAQSVKVMAAGVFNKLCDGNLALAVQRFCSGISDADSFVEFSGSSIIDDTIPVGTGSIGMPCTNNLALLSEIVRKNTLCINSAHSGSLLTYWTNLQYAATNGQVWRPVADMMERERFGGIEEDTDAFRNDIGNGTTAASAWNMMNNFQARYSSAISWVWLDTPNTLGFTGGSGAGINNSNWVAACAGARTNLFNFSRYVPFGRYLTLELLNQVSRDNPPTHLDGTTPLARAACVQFAQMAAGLPWTMSFNGSTNLQTASGILNYTNTWHYPMTFNLQITNSGAIWKNGAAVLTSFTGTWPLKVYPGDIVNITNAAYSTADTTQ
jgi:hypothetical protein